MTERQYAVAIDGPSGAGKSTLARAAAEALHILYVDTGAIYRTIGVYMYRHDIAPTDAPAVIAALPEITVALRYDEEGLQRMYLNGEDVTKEIRLPMISKYASDVSAIPEVRAFLMELQRSLAREHSVIMDGRDIGTVVLPDAEVKVFLCADVETRARRRFLELEQRGTPKPFDEELVRTYATKCGRVFSVEEHSIIGGLGDAVASAIAGHGCTCFKKIGIMDRFGQSGKPAALLEEYGLTAAQIADSMLQSF